MFAATNIVKRRDTTLWLATETNTKHYFGSVRMGTLFSLPYATCRRVFKEGSQGSVSSIPWPSRNAFACRRSRNCSEQSSAPRVNGHGLVVQTNIRSVRDVEDAVTSTRICGSLHTDFKTCLIQSHSGLRKPPADNSFSPCSCERQWPPRSTIGSVQRSESRSFSYIISTLLSRSATVPCMLRS